MPLFLLRLRGGRQGAFDCELQFAISNSLRFPRLSALQLADLICSLSPHFAPFTERCSFRRLQPPHAFLCPSHSHRYPPVSPSWLDGRQPISCRLYMMNLEKNANMHGIVVVFAMYLAIYFRMRWPWAALPFRVNALCYHVSCVFEFTFYRGSGFLFFSFGFPDPGVHVAHPVIIYE